MDSEDGRQRDDQMQRDAGDVVLLMSAQSVDRRHRQLLTELVASRNNQKFILLKFVTDFDHVTPDVLQMFKVKCHRSRSQCEMLIAKLLLPFRKSGSLHLMAMSEF